MKGAWSTDVQMYIVYPLTRDGFGQLMMRRIFCPRWQGKGLVKMSDLAGEEGICSTHVEINFVYLLAWEGFNQHVLRYILFLAGMGGVRSTRVEILFLSVLACDGFGEHMLRCILCIRWHGMGLFNTCRDESFAFAGTGGLINTC
jgi:hypothetical protein